MVKYSGINHLAMATRDMDTTIRKNTLPHRFIVFGRYPLPARTKTRLIQALGPTGAADLHRRMTEKTVKKVKEIGSRRSIEVEFCFEGGTECKVRRWLGSDMIYSHQESGDLGERMYLAFRKAFYRGCRKVVLLGTDIPELRIELLEEALDALMDHDLVIGPSNDGGYWLMGLNRPVDLFHGLNWGSRTVLEQTLSLAMRYHFKVHQLETLTDIDTVEDLDQRLPEEMNRKPYLSIVIPTLNEGSNIKASIHSAHHEDAEIIVMDGGSIDNTVAQAMDAGARVETSPRGRVAQQNRGAKLAQGRVILFLHGDTLLPTHYMTHIFEALMDPKTVAGSFRFKTDLDHPLMKIIESLTNFRSRIFELPYGDQGLFVRRSVFESLGGFPEVSLAEDLFLVRLLSKRGRIRIVPSKVITSGRRWRELGVLRTTLINQVIVAGCYLGVSPGVLARLYRI